MTGVLDTDTHTTEKCNIPGYLKVEDNMEILEHS